MRRIYKPYPKPPSTQGGFLMLSASLALILFSSAMLYYFTERAKVDDQKRAEAQAEVLDKVRRAGNLLILENYADFQAGRDIQRDNGAILTFGPDQGQALQPTVAAMQGLNLGIETISDTPIYKSLSNGGYRLQITREPAGCEAANLGATCRISGLACFTEPLRDPRKPQQDVDDFAIGKMLTKLGVDSGVSFAGTPNEITGFNGAWTGENFVGGQGIVCSRFGWGSSLFTTFLHVRDQRDPEFQNNVSMGGGIRVQRDGVNLSDPCTADEDGLAVWGEVDGNPVWLRCNGASWAPGNGITYGAMSTVCNQNGQFGIDPATGVSLICSSGRWASSSGRGLMSARYLGNGAVLTRAQANAECGPSTQAVPFVATVSASNIIGVNNSGNNTGSFQGSIAPQGQDFRVSITGADGSPAGNNATALVIVQCTPI